MDLSINVVCLGSDGTWEREIRSRNDTTPMTKLEKGSKEQMMFLLNSNVEYKIPPPCLLQGMGFMRDR